MKNIIWFLYLTLLIFPSQLPSAYSQIISEEESSQNMNLDLSGYDVHLNEAAEIYKIYCEQVYTFRILNASERRIITICSNAKKHGYRFLKNMKICIHSGDYLQNSAQIIQSYEKALNRIETYIRSQGGSASCNI